MLFLEFCVFFTFIVLIAKFSAHNENDYWNILIQNESLQLALFSKIIKAPIWWNFIKISKTPAKLITVLFASFNEQSSGSKWISVVESDLKKADCA
jgi:hypothetical protein